MANKIGVTQSTYLKRNPSVRLPQNVKFKNQSTTYRSSLLKIIPKQVGGKQKDGTQNLAIRNIKFPINFLYVKFLHFCFFFFFKILTIHNIAPRQIFNLYFLLIMFLIPKIINTCELLCTFWKYGKDFVFQGKKTKSFGEGKV